MRRSGTSLSALAVQKLLSLSSPPLSYLPRSPAALCRVVCRVATNCLAQNDNGVVDVSDLLLMLGSFGGSCTREVRCISLRAWSSSRACLGRQLVEPHHGHEGFESETARAVFSQRAFIF
jgi:hypothetical protein